VQCKLVAADDTHACEFNLAACSAFPRHKKRAWFAYAQKKSCEEICLKTCAAANAKNFCMQKCVPNCNMNRSK
jgi:hypothetical protein